MGGVDPAAAGTSPPGDERYRALAERLAVVRGRIEAAAVAAGRDPASVTLIAVTKTYPVEDVRRLADLGVHDFAENRDQEAAPKANRAADLGLTWHFIGQLQSNKVRSVLSYADVVHSVDRVRLVAALSKGAQVRGRDVTCLVQLSLDPVDAPAGGRGGAAPAEASAVADAVAAAPGLRLGGFMAVAPLGEDPRAAFERLAGLVARLRAGHPSAAVVSAGMSSDLEAAIAAGATHVRVGTALLGLRPPLG